MSSVIGENTSLCSSAVEQFAVNEWVVGSNPTVRAYSGVEQSGSSSGS